MNLNRFVRYSLIAVSLCTITAPSVAEVPMEPYPPEYTEQYLQDCLNTSMSEGLAEPEAKKLCDCTLAQFQQQYSLEAFKELNAKAQTDEAAASELVEVGQFCFESLLYE